jgi:hypothetical protein
VLGDWVDVLPGRDEPVEWGHRIRPLLGHVFGDVLDAEEPFLGVESQNVAL